MEKEVSEFKELKDKPILLKARYEEMLSVLNKRDEEMKKKSRYGECFES